MRRAGLGQSLQVEDAGTGVTVQVLVESEAMGPALIQRMGAVLASGELAWRMAADAVLGAASIGMDAGAITLDMDGSKAGLKSAPLPDGSMDGDDSDALSGGEVAGLTVGVVALVVLCAGLACYMAMSKGKGRMRVSPREEARADPGLVIAT